MTRYLVIYSAEIEATSAMDAVSQARADIIGAGSRGTQFRVGHLAPRVCIIERWEFITVASDTQRSV